MYSPFPTENNVEHIEQENGIIDQLIKNSEPQKFNGVSYIPEALPQ